MPLWMQTPETEWKWRRREKENERGGGGGKKNDNSALQYIEMYKIFSRHNLSAQMSCRLSMGILYYTSHHVCASLVSISTHTLSNFMSKRLSRRQWVRCCFSSMKIEKKNYYPLLMRVQRRMAMSVSSDIKKKLDRHRMPTAEYQYTECMGLCYCVQKNIETIRLFFFFVSTNRQTKMSNLWAFWMIQNDPIHFLFSFYCWRTEWRDPMRKTRESMTLLSTLIKSNLSQRIQTFNFFFFAGFRSSLDSQSLDVSKSNGFEVYHFQVYECVCACIFATWLNCLAIEKIVAFNMRDSSFYWNWMTARKRHNFVV